MSRALLRGVSIKPSDVLRFLAALGLLGVIAALVLWRVTPRPSLRPARVEAPVRPIPSPAQPAAASVPAGGCDDRAWAAAAKSNAATLDSLAWAPFSGPETGWRAYAAVVAHHIGVACPADSPGFAKAYAAWQAAHHFTSDGVFKPAEFRPLLVEIELQRPFVQLTRRGLCPEPPAPNVLAQATPEEGFGRKVVSLRAGALQAYRRLTQAARAAGVARGPDDFKLISGFRGPAEEAARCASGDCNTVTKASCSAHRTGLAIDLYLGRAPGEDPVSTAPENRIAITRTPAYAWLVENAGRFGFLNYPYEPWHWEWTGEPP